MPLLLHLLQLDLMTWEPTYGRKRRPIATLMAPANFAQQRTAEQLGLAKTDLQAQWRAAPTVWAHGALGMLLCS